MSSHCIQFQPGMPMPEFLSVFSTQAQCAETLMRSPWPHGFGCPRCGSAEHYVVGQGAGKLFQRNGVRRCRPICRAWITSMNPSTPPAPPRAVVPP
jgi:hypothetical protein